MFIFKTVKCCFRTTPTQLMCIIMYRHAAYKKILWIVNNFDTNGMWVNNRLSYV